MNKNNKLKSILMQYNSDSNFHYSVFRATKFGVFTDQECFDLIAERHLDLINNQIEYNCNLVLAKLSIDFFFRQ